MTYLTSNAIRSIELSPLCWEYTNKARHRRGLFDTDEVFNHLDKELQDSLSRIEDEYQATESRQSNREDQVRT
jgi:hypothetical protein